MFLTSIYICWLFTYEYLCFTSKNLFCRRLLGKKPFNRVELVKRITKHLERINIVYVKVFQSLCLEKDILYDDEKDYLMKYTDNVPYSNDDIDFEVLDKLEEEFGIHLENRRPVNSGIVGVVFKGKDIDNKKIVVKMLKPNIKDKYDLAFEEIEMLATYLQYVPYLNTINCIRIIEDSKENILEQTDFKKEIKNILFFKDKYKNHKEFVIPTVYTNITDKYNNIIVMSDITGLTFNDIKNLDSETKDIFAKLYSKWGLLGTLYYSCAQGDFHAGNMFFYINDSNNDDIPKYQLGVIDFGICYYFIPENQNTYFTFFYNIQCKREYDKIYKVLPTLIENKDYYYTFSFEKKQSLKEELIDMAKKYGHKNLNINFFINLSRIFKSYGLIYTKEFNNMCMSIQITNSLGSSLTPGGTQEIQNNLIEEFIKINALIEINEE
tara:strand:- start:2476 stop:3786 length:1311 start_codon:yes stop_codon:yes gene_type:complete